MTPRPLVHIIDDEDTVRESLGLLLDQAGYDTQDFPSAEDFLNAKPRIDQACVLADVRMAGMSGLELLRVMKERGLNLPIIIITGHGDVSMAVRALKEGAIDFIEKPFDEDVLLRAVAEGLSIGERSSALRRQLNEIRRCVQDLTPREYEVMQLVARGYSNKAVALELNISVRTVEIHRARVMEKMKAESLSDLVRMCLRVEEALPPLTRSE